METKIRGLGHAHLLTGAMDVRVGTVGMDAILETAVTGENRGRGAATPATPITVTAAQRAETETPEETAGSTRTGDC